MRQRILTVLSCLSVVLASALSGLFIVRPSIAKAYISPGDPKGFVNDFAGIIDDSTQSEIENDLVSFAQATSNEIVVVTVKGLEGDSVDNFANELFREWGIGGKENNNGVLLLVSPSDRKVRIEVGYGLEGAITDLESGRIIDAEVLPAFRNNDYKSGISLAVAGLKTAAQGEYNAPDNSAKKSSGFGNSLFYIFFGFVWLSAFLARSKSWWAGGVIGTIIAGIGWFVISSIGLRVALAVLAPVIGLLLDFLVSKNYQKNISKGGSGGFFPTIGGFSSGSGGGFGGFGGGSSGGGGSSDSW